jgi:SpoIID/LytB domain protein
MRRAEIAALACVLAVVSFGIAAPAAHAAAVPLPSDASVLAQGHGWGHGRGMGQYGAKGMAQSGSTWSQILAHFYSKISLSTRTAENIRVLLATTSSVLVTSDSALTVYNGSTKVATSDATYKFFRVRYANSSYVVEKASAWNGTWRAVTTKTSTIVFRPGSAVLQLVSGGGSVHYYRGRIEARWSSSSGALLAINDLSLEQYLYGSVPREMPASWSAEALKAQAVAARTYAAYKKDYARSQGYAYDICASTMCQVYGGYASKSSPTSTSVTHLEYSSSNAAVDATAGRVMLYGGKPILSEYSSSTGGYTAPGTVAYLSPVPDSGDGVSPLHDWDSKLTVAQIEKKWPSIGRLVDLKVTQRNGYGEWGGRVLSMSIIGTSATVTVSGYGFMNAFPWSSYSDGLYGNWFRILTWKAEPVTPRVPTVVSGSVATMRVAVRNTGTAFWPVGGTVRLATSTTSRFAGSGWISSTRPASVTANLTDPTKKSVAPGQTAEFRFPLHAENVKPGAYKETYRVVNDGVTPASAWFSVTIPVLPGWTSEVPNLVSNDSFESGTKAWTAAGFASGDGSTSAAWRDGLRSLVLKGGTKRVAQQIAFGGTAPRRFTIAGWSRGDGTNASGGAIDLSATVRYADGTTAVTHVPFPKGPHAWTYGEAVVSAAKPFTSIAVVAAVANQSGSAYFDALRLYESPVANASFEKGLTGWTASGLSSGDGAAVGDAKDGVTWLKLTGAGATGVRQTVPLSGATGRRLVLSAWNKTSGATSTATPPIVQATFVNTDGTRTSQSLAFPAADHAWTYGEVVARAAKPYKAVVLQVLYNDQTGTAGFDSVRLAESFAANPGFESDLASWSPFGFGDAGDGIMTSPVRDGAKALKLSGSGRQGVLQSIALSSVAGRKLLVSTIAKNTGTSTSGGAITIVVAFRNRDGSTSRYYAHLPKAPNDWTFLERIFTAPKAFSSVDVYLMVIDQPGSVIFDALRVALG